MGTFGITIVGQFIHNLYEHFGSFKHTITLHPFIFKIFFFKKFFKQKKFFFHIIFFSNLFLHISTSFLHFHQSPSPCHDLLCDPQALSFINLLQISYRHLINLSSDCVMFKNLWNSSTTGHESLLNLLFLQPVLQIGIGPILRDVHLGICSALTGGRV